MLSYAEGNIQLDWIFQHIPTTLNIQGTSRSQPNSPEDGHAAKIIESATFFNSILLILYEKNIDFTPYILDLSNGEQFSSWFLSLNPKGDVPVLQDGALIVPDSTLIINYLEGKFRGGNYTPLIPTDTSSKEYTKQLLYEEILQQLPVGALSLGSFIHEDLKLTPKPPFIGPIRKSCLKNNEKVYEILKKSVNEAESFQKTALLKKLDLQDRRKELVYSRVDFQRVLERFEEILKFFEKELLANPEREWLLSSEFSAVDASFGLLLHRLYSLGFENYFWAFGKLPKVESYFLRFKQRNSYIKLMPTNVEILKDIWSKTPSNYKIGAGVIGMAMFAAFAHK